MTIEKIKLKPFTRFLPKVEITRGEDSELSLSFPASSETPVERWYGTEILSHAKGAVRTGRADNGAMPLLFNHRTDDPIGIVDAARIEGGKMFVDAHLFDTERGKEVSAMIKGGLRNVSIAYQSFEIVENRENETFVSTDWEPFEVSIVTVPADYTVGLGRNLEIESEARIVRASKQPTAGGGSEMGDEVNLELNPSGGGNAPAGGPAPGATIRAGEEAPNVVAMEKARARAIENLCKVNRLGDNYRDMWVQSGFSLEQVADDILKIHEERGKLAPNPVTKLGLSERETKTFSLSRAIVAARDNNWKNAGFELDCVRSVADKLGKSPEPHKFCIPFEVLERPHDTDEIRALRSQLGLSQRDLTAGVAGAGGFLIGTQNVGFIEMLRNRSVAFSMGARRLSGLQGNVTIPRQSAAASAFWLSTEATAITESQQTFVQVALTPKNVGAYTEVSRQLLIQSSPGAEGIITEDLAIVVALGADLAALEGSGAAGQPTGIANTAGIGSVAGAAMDFAKVIEFQTDVANANVMPARGGYVTTPTVSGLLLQRVKFSGTASPLLEGNVWGGTMVGFPLMSSNQPTAATMVFGDWNDLVIAEWGVLEVEVNPYANFQAGIIGVRAIYSLDVGVRRPFAFTRATAIT